MLLKSIEKYSEKESVFGFFKVLKHKHQLGESKYKTLAPDIQNPSKSQINRYRYTFEQVIDEAEDYGLLKYGVDDELVLTQVGGEVLRLYEEQGISEFNNRLFEFMEGQYEAFRYLIESLYKVNKYKPGLLIFPSYSPRQLGFERSAIKTRKDIVEYSDALVERLQEDILKYLGENRVLADKNRQLLVRLTEVGLLPQGLGQDFDPAKYNVIIKRFRDYWINYFLKDMYGYEFSLTSFEVWTYRGKQIGIIQATEFYPNFNGRLVYPTAVVLKSVQSNDFRKLYEYSDEFSLFIHEPKENENQDAFVDSLVKAYFNLRRSNRSYFVSLLALREIVCYNMKISESLFQKLLNTTYRLNLAGELKIRISLEVDRLPEETEAMYLKQEPVMVDGKYRNIIAIDVTKEEKAR